MSATLGDVTDLAADLSRRTGRSTATVTADIRPVPLHHYYAVTPLHETISDLLAGGQAPDLRRPLHAGGRARTGAVADQHQHRHPGRDAT